MQSALLQINLCNNIDKVVRDFLWDNSTGKQKVHLVKWDTITQGKDHGGLGIKRMHNKNLAFMAKLGWRLLTEVKENRLWARILADKYIRGEATLSKLRKMQGSSNAWRGIALAANILSKGKKRQFTMGRTHSFGRMFG